MIDLDKDLTYAETAAIEATVFTGVYAAWVAAYSRREGMSDEDIDTLAWDMASNTTDCFFDNRISELTIGQTIGQALRQEREEHLAKAKEQDAK
jgi:hypothetical protein